MTSGVSIDVHINKGFLFKELKKVNVVKPIMIEGLPGMGNVGKITVDFIIESLKAEKIAEVYADYFAHCVLVQQDGSCQLPSIGVYYKKIKKRDFIFVTGEVQPIDERGCYDFCENLIEYFKSKNGIEIITIGGIGLEDIPNEPRVFICGNNKKIIERYKSSGVKTNASGVVGPILGVSGVLVGVARLHDINALAVLAETFGNPMYLGVKGAREVLRFLELKLGLGIDIKSLDKEIKYVEKEIKGKIDKMLLMHPEDSCLQKKDSTNYIG